MSQAPEDLQSEPLDADEPQDPSDIVDAVEDNPSPEGEMGVDPDDPELTEQVKALRIGRDQIMQRGWSWIAAGVPYSQVKYYTNKYGKYRQDCSGFVSMCWALPHSYVTWTLMRVAHKIPRNQLKKGDALLVERHHVAIFEKWLDGGAVRVYEQTPPRARWADWPASKANKYQPIRFNGVEG